MATEDKITKLLENKAIARALKEVEETDDTDEEKYEAMFLRIDSIAFSGSLTRQEYLEADAFFYEYFIGEE